MIGSIEDALSCKGTDLTKDGKCTGCGECCSNLLPMTNLEIHKIKKYIIKNSIKPHAHCQFPLTDYYDMVCPFLDGSKKEKKCDIYEVRPQICKSFCCNNLKKQPIRVEQLKEMSPIDVRATFFGGSDLISKIPGIKL